MMLAPAKAILFPRAFRGSVEVIRSIYCFLVITSSLFAVFQKKKKLCYKTEASFKRKRETTTKNIYISPGKQVILRSCCTFMTRSCDSLAWPYGTVFTVWAHDVEDRQRGFKSQLYLSIWVTLDKPQSHHVFKCGIVISTSHNCGWFREWTRWWMQSIYNGIWITVGCHGYYCCIVQN